MGLLIVFEGVDRSGKSSQIQLLHDFLHTKFPTKSVHRLSFPGTLAQNALLKCLFFVAIRHFRR